MFIKWLRLAHGPFEHFPCHEHFTKDFQKAHQSGAVGVGTVLSKIFANASQCLRRELSKSAVDRQLLTSVIVELVVKTHRLCF